MNNEEKINEIQADVKSLIEINKLVRHEQERKNEILFNFMNETNKSLSAIEQSLINNKEYISSVSGSLKDHKNNHFSWLKIFGVAIGAIGGLMAIGQQINSWNK